MKKVVSDFKTPKVRNRKNMFFVCYRVRKYCKTCLLLFTFLSLQTHARIKVFPGKSLLLGVPSPLGSHPVWALGRCLLTYSAQTACMCQPLSSPGQQSIESLRDLPLIKAVFISCFGGSLPAPSSPWPEDQSGQGGHRVCILSPGPHSPGSSAAPEGRGCPQSATSYAPALSSLCLS